MERLTNIQHVHLLVFVMVVTFVVLMAGTQVCGYTFYECIHVGMPGAGTTVEYEHLKLL